MAGQPPYPENRAEPNNSAAGAENPEIRRIFVRIVPASRTVVADSPCAEPAGGASRGGGKKIQTQTIYGRRKNHLFDGRREQDLHQPETGVEQHLPLFFLRREDRHHRSERLG